MFVVFKVRNRHVVKKSFIQNVVPHLQLVLLVEILLVILGHLWYTFQMDHILVVTVGGL